MQGQSCKIFSLSGMDPHNHSAQALGGHSGGLGVGGWGGGDGDGAMSDVNFDEYPCSRQRNIEKGPMKNMLFVLTFYLVNVYLT